MTIQSQYGIFVNLTDRLGGNRRRRITWTSSRRWLTRSVTVLGMRTPITSSPATTVLTRSRTAITRSGSKRCERDVMCIPVKLKQLLCSIFHFFFFLHFYWHKFCFINRNVGFFLVKLLLVSIHLFRIIEKLLGLFRQADLQNGKGREMLRMCLVEWRMLIKMKLINHWVFYSIFKLGGKQLPLNQVHCQMPCKHTCISIFRNV